MSAPFFLVVYSNGDIWKHTNPNFELNPPSSEGGTVVKIFRINSDASAQKITTLSGTIGSSLAATGGATNGYGTELT
jgi:hypothetical protein